MKRLFILMLGVILIMGGCHGPSDSYDKNYIVKIFDFELSPDEEKIAFSALTPIGNTDIWVVDINGKNLKKLTFKDRSASNHIARFFKKYKLNDYFEIDMHSPKWTKDGRILFCQKLSRHTLWDVYTVKLKNLTIRPDGTGAKAATSADEPTKKEIRGPVNIFKAFELSEKHKKKIFLRDNNLWYSDENNSVPRLLIQ